MDIPLYCKIWSNAGFAMLVRTFKDLSLIFLKTPQKNMYVLKKISRTQVTAASAAQLTAPGDGEESNSGDSSDSSDGGPSPDDVLIASHGIIMAAIFLVLYPIGALLMPLLSRWIVHAVWQTIAFVAMWAAFGIGYAVAQRESEVWLDGY